MGEEGSLSLFCSGCWEQVIQGRSRLYLDHVVWCFCLLDVNHCLFWGEVDLAGAACGTGRRFLRGLRLGIHLLLWRGAGCHDGAET